MSERSAAIGFASASAGAPPPNNSACGLEMNDQVTASTRPRVASARLALRRRSLRGGENGLARRVAAREFGRGHAIDAGDAHDFLDDIGLAFDIRPPRRHRDLHHSCRCRRRRSRAFRGCASSPATAGRDRTRRFTSSTGNSISLSGDFASPATMISDAVSAAELDDKLGREFETRQHEIRIDAALEAIARIGMDAELAAGLRDIERLPERRFDQHVGRRLRAAGRFAAHDAGERFDALLVGDHADRVVELIGLAVEREQPLALLARGGPSDCRGPWRHRTHAAGGRGRR